MTDNNWTPEQRQIAAWYTSGWTQAQIADQLGVGKTYVSRAIKAMGLRKDGLTEAQALKRRIDIETYLLEGIRQAQIAQTLGISEATVSREVARIKQGWLDDLDDNRQKHRARITQELAKLRRTAWKEFDESKLKRTKTKLKRNIVGELSPAEVQTETRNGDPRYLKIIADATATEAVLLGANAPTQVEHSGKDGEPIPVVIVDMPLDEI